MMQGFLLRTGVILGPLAVACWAGCSDDPSPSDPGPADAGPDVTVDAPPPPPADAGADASTKRDCSNDTLADGLPKHLECTGLYADFAAKTLAADVKLYKPGYEFWSDGAEKARYVLLPAGSKIDITDFDEWKYPVGIKLWKEFKLGGKRIETRIFTKTGASDWVHTAYRWTDDESDAVRLDAGEKIPGLGPDGGIYEVPNTGQCNNCHDGRVEPVLGFEAVNLGSADATGVTLASLAADGRFTGAPPKTALPLPEDATGKAAAALGFMHVNCGPCHNQNGQATFRAHFLVKASQLVADGGTPTVDSLDVWTQAYCIDSSRTNPNTTLPYKLIQGGDPATSLTSILSGSRADAGEEPSTAVQMPPIVTRAVDVAGHAKLDAWITALPACP